METDSVAAMTTSGSRIIERINKSNIIFEFGLLLFEVHGMRGLDGFHCVLGAIKYSGHFPMMEKKGTASELNIHETVYN